MYFNPNYRRNLTCPVLISICVLIGIVFHVLGLTWLESIRLTSIKISEDKDQGIDLERAATATPKISPTVEYYDGWKIIYSEQKLRVEVETIHNSNYKVRDGDKCSNSLPNFVLVGVDKCGTRELMDLLSIHPNIVTKKNPYTLEPTDRQMVIDKMPCKYHDQLSGFKMHTGLSDISVPDEINALNPDMKIMAIVREPISRVMSRLTFIPSSDPKKRVIKDSKAMKTYIQKAINDTLYNNKPDQAIIQSTYDVGIERYLKKFKQDQVLVVESREFQNNPVRVLKKVERFLGISSFISDQNFVFNNKKKFFCIRKTFTESKTMICYQSNRGRKLIELDREDKEKLAIYFRSHNENLFRIIGRRFDW